MKTTRPLPVHRTAWVLCSAAVFFVCAVYLRGWPMTLPTRLAVLPVVAVGAAAVGWVLQLFWGLSGGIRARTSTTRKQPVFLALLLVGIAVSAGYLGRHTLLRQYDAVRLANFVRRISDADHVSATCLGNKSISLAFKGDAAKRIVGAVSSGVSARLPDGEFAAAYNVVATFYSGTNSLGQIKLCGSLFLLESNESPFFSETLETVVYAPVLEALRESPAQQSK